MFWILKFVSELPIGALLYKALPAILGTVFGWLLSGWRWRRYVQRLMTGDASETVIVEQVMITCGVNSRAMRTRIVTVRTADTIFPDNPAAKRRFVRAVEKATKEEPIVTFEGPGGAYLLREIRAAIAGGLGQQPFKHEAWVLCIARIPLGACDHRSVIAFLVRPTDLERTFREWKACKGLAVEARSESFKLFALHRIARAFEEQRKAAEARGEPSFLTSMAVLDLALDTRFSALPTVAPVWDEVTE